MYSHFIVWVITAEVEEPMVHNFNQILEDILRRNPHLNREDVLKIGCTQIIRTFIHNLASLQKPHNEAVMLTNRYSKEILDELGIPYVPTPYDPPNG